MFKNKPQKRESHGSYSSIEKFRDELFEVRVDLKAYIRNINVLIVCATVIISILAFFGYNKIDSVEKQILEKANARLAITDSLLAKINEKKLDSINELLSRKIVEYENTIKNFELVINQNKVIEKKLFELLPLNEQLLSFPHESYYQEQQGDYFEIYPFPDKFKNNEKAFVYFKFLEPFDISDAECIAIQIFQINRNVLLNAKYYKVNQRLNKIAIQFAYEKGKYDLFIGFFTKQNNGFHYYRMKKVIEII